MIKVNFTDFWPGFDENNLFLKFLKKHFSIAISNNPDYLFYSVHGNSHLKYKDCIKIFYTGENLVPDFNLCDYALGFQYIDFGDRYLRFPLHVYYQWFYTDYFNCRPDSINIIRNKGDELHKRKFCNFIYSNNVSSDPMRDLFFYELNKYKKVDSGGKHLNNIGKPVADKMGFIKDYKFTIAFENSSVPGYVTEKLIEPIIMSSLPVYYGNPLVHMEFNVDSFIQVKDKNDFDRAIKEIIFLDQNDDNYLEKLNQPKFKYENALQDWEEKLLAFMKNIFNQPVTTAYRRTHYGFNRFHIEDLKQQAHLLEERKRKNYIKTKIKGLFYKMLTLLGK